MTLNTKTCGCFMISFSFNIVLTHNYCPLLAERDSVLVLKVDESRCNSAEGRGVKLQGSSF